MEELIQGLMTKCGLDEETAQKVFSFLQENAGNLPAMLASADNLDAVKDQLADKLPGGLGSFLK